MPVTTLLEAQAMPEPPPNWMWTLTLLGPDGIFIPPARILEGNAPFYSIDTESVPANGLNMAFPNGVSLPPLDVVFYESFTFEMLWQMLKWSKMIRDDSNNYGLYSTFTGTALYMFHDSMGIPQFIYEIDGIWPTVINPLNLSYEGSGGFSVGVSFETYSKFGEISLLGTAEDLVEDLVGDIPIVNTVLPLAETIGTGML